MTAVVIPVTCVVGLDHTSPTGWCLGTCWVSAAGRDEAPGAGGWGCAVASPMSPRSTQLADARPGGAMLGERVSRWLLLGTCSPVPLDCELLEDKGFAFRFESDGPPLESLLLARPVFQKALDISYPSVE